MKLHRSVRNVFYFTIYSILDPHSDIVDKREMPICGESLVILGVKLSTKHTLFCGIFIGIYRLFGFLIYFEYSPRVACLFIMCMISWELCQFELALAVFILD